MVFMAVCFCQRQNCSDWVFQEPSAFRPGLHSVLTLPLNPLQPVQILCSLGRQCGGAGHNLGAGYVWLGEGPAATAHIFA